MPGTMAFRIGKCLKNLAITKKIHMEKIDGFFSVLTLRADGYKQEIFHRKSIEQTYCTHLSSVV